MLPLAQKHTQTLHSALFLLLNGMSEGGVNWCIQRPLGGSRSFLKVQPVGRMTAEFLIQTRTLNKGNTSHI